METKWIGLVLTALLAGLAGGLISGYLVIQQQTDFANLASDISNLVSEIENLNSKLDKLQKELNDLKANLQINGSNETSSGDTLTRYEKLEFTSCYAVKGTSGFTVNLKLKNTGSAAATIDIIFFNGVPHDAAEISDDVLVTEFVGKKLNPGDELLGTITLTTDTDSPFKSGMSLELMIQTVAGKQYPRVIVLP